MASSTGILCDVCEVEHITKNAEHWCPECKQGLCSQCLRYHNALKSSRNHGVISVGSYIQLPPSIFKIKQYCPDHDRKLTNYCPQHESLCCPLCIPANHKDCHGILALEEMINSSKTSTLLNSMEQSLKYIKTNMDKIIKNKKQNLATIKSQRQEFYDVIKQMREKINKHLDKLEEQILKDLSTEETKVKLQIDKILTKFKENTEKVEELQRNISTIKQYASDLQIFLGSKTIETEVQKQEKAMQSIFDDRSVDEVFLKCHIENSISDILSSVSTFGTISIELGHTRVVMKTEKDKQAQIVSYRPERVKPIHDIGLILKWNVNTEIHVDDNTSIICGCTFSLTGDIILTDYCNNRLLTLKEDGSFYNEIYLSLIHPTNVTFIDNRTVAVSFQSSCGVEIIDIKDKTTVRIIETTSYCSGISYRNGFLLFAEHANGIYRVQLPNGVKSLLISRNAVEYWDCLTLSDDKIYHAIHNEDKICCYAMSGEKIWEYNDKTKLKNPIGVTIDNYSNIYVASHGNSSIIVISADGKNARCLLETADGINSPYGICIDKENKLCNCKFI
ncbi:unnamed protein product [Mytilus coruscus]|uniref:B box-type domain-containing protein n=1 Tax=Mytilus coruscus TaxID=42192 RepID=A0A6J8EGB1_MYTCO|nr:unnamed protein product [Mytilus coruscus]